MINRLFDVPFYKGIKIDNNYTIYIMNDNDDIIRYYEYPSTGVKYDSTIINPIELINLSFYGVRNRLDFDDYYRTDDGIISNDVKFKPIPNVPNGYYISRFGAVYSTHTNGLRKQEIDKDGYHRISFNFKGTTHMGIHRLVYLSWIGDIPNGLVIYHKDDNKWNNDVNNLHAVTAKFNSRKAANNGKYKCTFHWNEEKVRTVCELMEKNVKVADIARMIGVDGSDKRLYKNFRNQLYSFRTSNSSWYDITSNYDFKNYDGNIRPDSTLRDGEIMYMRELYSAGYSSIEISDIMGIKYTRYINKLITGKKRKFK